MGFLGVLATSTFTGMEKLFYAYIIASRSRTLYVGFTSDLYVRVMQHRAGAYQGFTTEYQCHRLVWYERYGSPIKAISREKQIKRWNRAKKITLIERDNPTWVDLAAEWGTRIQLYGEAST